VGKSHGALRKEDGNSERANPHKGESFGREIKVMERVSQSLGVGYVMAGLRSEGFMESLSGLVIGNLPSPSAGIGYEM
jgi:hypothetical protein